MKIRHLILVSLAILIFPEPSRAQDRLAFVVGNDAYQNIESLRKAVNDARAIATALRKLGFNVTIGENLQRRDFVRGLANFEGRLKPGDVAFVFYAGHGVEIDGANYLLPVDIPKVTPGQQSVLKDEAISTDGLIQRLKVRGTRSQVLVLDACRENPFRDAAGRSLGGARGLGPSLASNGVFILYSAGIGEVALDRLSDNDGNPNSVFTRTLVPLLENPDLSLVRLAKETRAKVKGLAETIGHRQSPAYYDEIDGDLFLARLGGGTPTPALPASVPPSAPPAPVPSVPAPDPNLAGFIFPDSDRRILTRKEIQQLPLPVRRYARNEIFARKGRFFQDEVLRAYFSRFAWYRPNRWDIDLNAIEEANVKLIQSLER
ncbi:MAG: caspase family protein [Rhizobiales bacterium]|nr:caspase family protein [Hyphomicrobiales bacterium]